MIVLDITMPNLNGIDTSHQINALCPAAKIVILSMHGTTEHIYRALQAGAQGYILKESAGSEVVDAIRTVQANQQYLSRKISRPCFGKLYPATGRPSVK